MKFFNRLIEKIYLKQDGNLVYYDSLTGVRSRLYYDMEAKTKYRNMEALIIYVDIDGLKNVNDSQGHHKGNIMIQKTVDNLKSLSDVYDICRIGGDEFILFADINFDIDKMKAIKHISYGYSAKEKYEDISFAVAKADQYMYKHKKRKYYKRRKIKLNKENHDTGEETNKNIE